MDVRVRCQQLAWNPLHWVSCEFVIAAAGGLPPERKPNRLERRAAAARARAKGRRHPAR